jgi:hypothetical protein
MIFPREPLLHPVPITELRPTQITIGLREVEEKRKEWRGLRAEKKNRFLGRHMIPVVLGPKDGHYIIDHHHLTRALHEEGVERLLVTLIDDLSFLDRATFWAVLDHRRWVHAYDADGRRCPFEDIPKTVGKLKNDPCRSLAGELRRAGGFAKDTELFGEFLWADFVRRTLGRKTIAKDFDAALKKALVLAKSAEAKYLPGWCGASDDTG